MGQNICINDESACHAGSDGKLTTSDTCMTPPFCIPITYTNIAESKVADQTVSSVKIQGHPACNQKSIFKISQGDSPGCCGGVSSGSVGQMAKFMEGSNNVTIGGEAAVYNGVLMNSNDENTDPKPLIQPPAEKAPAQTAEEPEQAKAYSQQFDFMAALGSAPGKTTIIERPAYEIWSKAGEKLDWGTLDKQGLTERVYTDEPTELIVWLGEGAWRFYHEHDHGEHDSEAEAPTTANIGFVFFNFAMAYLPELEYKLVADGQTVTGKTGINGATQALEELAPNSKVEVWVQKETSKEYKKIGTVTANAGETRYQAVSPKIKAEGTTEPHKNPPAAAPKTEPAAPAKKSEKKKAPPQKPKTEAAPNADNNPVAKLQPDTTLWLASNPVLSVFMYASWGMLKTLNRVVTGNENLNPATFASQATPGTPLGKGDLARLQALVKFAEKQVNFDYRGCVDDNGARAIDLVLDKYEHALIGDPSFEYEVKPHEKEKSNKPYQSIGLCLWYVKVALMQTRYVNGRPAAGLAKESVNDWPQFDYKDVSKERPPIEVTYLNAYAEKDIPKVERVYATEAKLKKLKGGLPDLQTKLGKAKKLNDAHKNEAAEKAVATRNREIESTEQDLAYAKNKAPEKQASVTYTQPDLMYTLPGDLIVYEQVDPIKEANPAGHIDIRTYHSFCSDFMWQRPIPALGQSSTKRYKVIGIFRKISDTMAMARVQAFLRIIREHEAKGYKNPYLALHFDGKVHETFSDFSTHPYADSEKDKPAGAYQIKYSTWNGIISATGWPVTFDAVMQDRLAMYLLQTYPLKQVPHPRHSALGYIMEGEVEKAVNETDLRSLFSCLPGGGKQQQMTMAELRGYFDKYVGEVSK